MESGPVPSNIQPYEQDLDLLKLLRERGQSPGELLKILRDAIQLPPELLRALIATLQDASGLLINPAGPKPGALPPMLRGSPNDDVSSDDQHITEPLVVSLRQASRILGDKAITYVYQLGNEGRLDLRKDGRKTVVTMASLRSYCETLPVAQLKVRPNRR
jgi:hypothetical protein